MEQSAHLLGQVMVNEEGPARRYYVRARSRKVYTHAINCALSVLYQQHGQQTHTTFNGIQITKNAKNEKVIDTHASNE